MHSRTCPRLIELTFVHYYFPSLNYTYTLLLEHIANYQSLYRTQSIMEDTEAPSHSPETRSSSFPQNPEDFDADPRISFSKLDSKFILEADDGQEFEFDDALKRWIPAVRPPPTRPRVSPPGISYVLSQTGRWILMPNVVCLWDYSWTMLFWNNRDRHMPFEAWMSRSRRSSRRRESRFIRTVTM